MPLNLSPEVTRHTDLSNTDFVRIARDFLKDSLWAVHPGKFDIDVLSRDILENDDRYRDFLAFYKREVNVYRHDHVTLFHNLKVFELYAHRRETWESFGLSDNIPTTNITFEQGLKEAVYKIIPINNMGNVVYFLKEIPQWLHVYSHELWFHNIDRYGNIIKTQKNFTYNRQSILADIERLKQEWQKLLSNQDSYNSSKEGKTFFIRRRFAIYQEIQKFQEEFDLLISGDTRYNQPQLVEDPNDHSPHRTPAIFPKPRIVSSP